MTCRGLAGLLLIAQPEPGCSMQAAIVDWKARFDAPAGSGNWIVAISACGTYLEQVSGCPR